MIYSPSQTKDWGFCPVYWWLKDKEGWIPKVVGKPQIAAIAGIAFAAGMAFYHEDSEAQNSLSPAQYARESAHAQVMQLQSQGFQFEQTFNLGTLEDQVEEAIQKTIQFNPIPPHWQILDVEYTLKEAGNARIDLGVHDGNSLAVVDYKLKLKLEAKWYNKTVQEFESDYQQMHYAWGYGQEKGQPVEHYYIALVVLAPQFSVKLHPFSVHPEALAWWEQRARANWQRMETEEFGDEPLPINPAHTNQYGPCPYKRACLEYKNDPVLMGQSYIKTRGQNVETGTA